MMNKVVLKEEILLSNAAIFILREMNKNKGWINYSQKFDYLRREKFVGYYRISEEGNPEYGNIRKQNNNSITSLYDYTMSDAWKELCKYNIVYHSNRYDEGCYIKYNITEKGYEILKLTRKIKFNSCKFIFKK